jgi:imidazolonepropionase-like amidohydrolase
MSKRSGVARALAVLSIFVCVGCRAETLTAIVNARILTMGRSGELERGSILIRDDKVVDVGAELPIPPNARRIDASGAIATPGFILMGGPAGAVEFPMTPGHDDSAAGGGLSAGFDIQYAVDPRSTYLPEIRREGSTLALITPSILPTDEKPFSYFGGQAAVIRLGVGGELIVKPAAAATLQLGVGSSRAIQIIQLKRLFDRLRAASKESRESEESSPPQIPGLADEDIAALNEVFSGKTPLLVSAGSKEDILQAIEFARTYELRIILDGAEEGWLLADEIAAANVPVLTSVEFDTPGEGEWARTMANAARLAAAGVQIALKLYAGGAIFKFPTSRYIAGLAVAHGMPYRKALESLTSVPARMLGIDDRFGSIEAGKQADIVLWTGDPLEPSSMVKMVMVGGVEQPLTSRKSLLRDRYLPNASTGSAEAVNKSHE